MKWVSIYSLKKSSILSIILIFILPLYSLAGSTNQWGIKLGVSISTQNFKYKTSEIDRDFDNYLGLHADAFVNFVDRKTYAFVAQISFSQKGCIETITPTFVDPVNHGYIDGDPIKFRNRTDYLSLSILGKLNLNLNVLNPYIIIGPRIDFLVNTKSETIPKSIFDNLNRNSFGMTLGIGREFSLFIPYKTLIEFQYSPDLTKMYDSQFLSIEKTSYEIKMGITF